MNKEKVSVISTVLNEENNIEEFIKSIMAQTKKPNELIIVDGGSGDKTYEILKKFSKKHKWIKVFQKKDANISQGRNYAISKAKNEIIVSADAGTKFKEDWLENLIKGFNGQVGFGVNKPLIKNKFQEVLAEVILHKNVCGSSRNMIFLKKIWKEVGGYPEDMKIGEDTLFDERIKRAGYHIGWINGAIGYWEMRKNLKEVEKQFFRYGYWDAIVYKKYKILPLKHKIAVIATLLVFPLYSLFWLISRISLNLKIRFVKRFNYVGGFIHGYFKYKEKK